jgi:hypothetical protein
MFLADYGFRVWLEGTVEIFETKEVSDVATFTNSGTFRGDRSIGLQAIFAYHMDFTDWVYLGVVYAVEPIPHLAFSDWLGTFWHTRRDR